VEHCAIKIDLVPSQVAQLGSTQSMPEGHQDRGCAPMLVPTFLCSLDHGVDLSGREAFATANLSVRSTSWRNSSIYFNPCCRTEF
jgi:hypothetical protein